MGVVQIFDHPNFKNYYTQPDFSEVEKLQGHRISIEEGYTIELVEAEERENK